MGYPCEKGLFTSRCAEKNTCFEFGLPIWMVVGF
jgi:hypothetical protein